MTLGTLGQTGEFDLAVGAENGFLKIDLQVVAEIGTVGGCIGIMPSAAEEGIETPASAASAAESFAEQVERIEPGSAACPAMAEARRSKPFI